MYHILNYKYVNPTAEESYIEESTVNPASESNYLWSSKAKNFQTALISETHLTHFRNPFGIKQRDFGGWERDSLP